MTYVYPFAHLADKNLDAKTDIFPFGQWANPAIESQLCYNALFGKGNYDGPDPALEGHWELQDNAASTTVVDRSGKARNGVLTGAGNTSASTGTPGPEWLSRYLSLDGTNDHVQNTSVPLTASQGTIHGWFRTSAVAVSRALLSFGEGLDDHWLSLQTYSVGSGQKIYFRLKTTATQLEGYSTNDLITNNQWFHLAFSSSPSGNVMYFNGVAVPVTYTTGNSSSTHWQDDLTVTTPELAIGRRTTTSTINPWNGFVSEAGIHSRALSAAEIAELYAGPEPYNQSIPTITGTVSRGSTITLNAGTWNTQNNGTPTYTYKLYSYSNTSGGDQKLVKTVTTTKTSQPFILRNSVHLVGRYLRLQVTASNDGGFDPMEAPTSVLVGPVTATEIVSSGLISHWSPSRQYPTSATTLLDRVGTYHLTYSGGSSVCNNWIHGDYNNGYKAVNVLENGYLQGPTATLGTVRTVSWWWFRTGSIGGRYILDSNVPSRRVFGVQSEAPAYYNGTAWTTIGPVINQNAWTHVVITIDSGTEAFKCYVNGVDVTVGSLVAAAPTMQNVTVGNRYAAPYNQQCGLLDSIRVYNRAITPSEVTELYNAGRSEYPAYTASYNALVGKGRHAPDQAMVVHYPLQDNPSSLVAVDNISGLNATLSATGFTQGVGPGGYLPNALTTTGTGNALLTVPATVVATLPTVPITYAAAVKTYLTNTYESNGRIYDSSKSGTSDHSWYQTASHVSTNYNGNNELNIARTANTWEQHAVSRLDGTIGGITGYKNGAVISSNVNTSTSDSFDNLTLFNHTGLANEMGGRLCDFIFAYRPFSLTDIQEHNLGPEPLNLTAPAAPTGTLSVGSVLTAQVGTWDMQLNTSVSLTHTYQWYRADDNAGTNLTLIGGATASTYTLVAGDANKYITCLVGGVNAGGRDTAEDTFSAYTAQVAGGGGATIVADSGTYAVSGQDAILDYDRIIPSEAGTYTLGGQIAALDVTKVITSDYGIYTQTGQDASLVETNVYTLDANHTNYLIDANAQAYFVIAKQLLSEQGSYVLDGQVANLVTSKLITSEQGTYSLDGQSAFLDETNVYYLDASHALYLLDTNAQAYFNLSRQVIAGQGDYSVSGQVASLITSRAIASAQGNYTITGHTVSLDTEADFPLGQGSYALNTSFELYLVVDRIVTMAQGTYTSFGNAVYFLRDLTRTFDQGTYGITGNDASLNIILAYFLQASHGLYLGDYNSQISFDLDRILTASKGDYLLTGQSSSFIRTLIEELETGNYLVEGNQISLGISGVGTPYYFFLFAHRN